jgi:hypothetical protein
MGDRTDRPYIESLNPLALEPSFHIVISYINFFYYIPVYKPTKSSPLK